MQTTDRKQETACSRQHTAESRQQRADNREQSTESRQQQFRILSGDDEDMSMGRALEECGWMVKHPIDRALEWEVTHTNTHTHTHAHTHTRTHTHTCVHIYTHTYIHTQVTSSDYIEENLETTSLQFELPDPTYSVLGPDDHFVTDSRGRQEHENTTRNHLMTN
jgi:hypothetical protein